jgi:hypothetical protein
VLAVLAAALAVAGAAPAAAHPLGNFTLNSYSGLRVGPDRLAVDYVLDMAEIPAFQARQAIDGDRDGKVSDAEAAGWRDRECPRLAGGLRATVDGRPLPLAATGATVAFPPGAGGLQTLRLECALAASLPAGRGHHDLAYRDGNQAGRVGWREITATGDGATLEQADVPAGSASRRLTAYPEDQLRSPLDQRTASVRFRPGGPRAGDAGEPGSGRAVARRGVDRATAAFTALVAARRLSPGFGLLALALALVLGAAHALAPGHGKTVMAAYLVGLRGSLGQAATIGATVTVTHTAGVLLLGLVLSASRAVASERVYPWLGLASGLLLAGVGLTLAARALRGPGRTTAATPTTTAATPMTTTTAAGPGGRWGGGDWWRWGWPGGWCRAPRRWWCCSAGSPSATPGSGWPCCSPTGSAWPPPSPASACSWPTCAAASTGGCRAPPRRCWPGPAGCCRSPPPR